MKYKIILYNYDILNVVSEYTEQCLVFVPLSFFERGFDSIGKTALLSPPVICDTEKIKLKKRIEKFNIKDVLIDNIGHIGFYRELNMNIHANAGFNITNKESLNIHKNLGFVSITLSHELKFSQIRDMIRKNEIETGITAYGKIPVMITENHIQYSYLKEKNGNKFFILDNIIFNSVPVYLADRKDILNSLNLSFVNLIFTDENKSTALKILNEYIGNQKTVLPAKFTRLYK